MTSCVLLMAERTMRQRAETEGPFKGVWHFFQAMCQPLTEGVRDRVGVQLCLECICKEFQE